MRQETRTYLAMSLKANNPLRNAMDCLQENIHTYLKQRHYFANKGPYSQSYGFSSGHVWMWELDHKESWAPKNWCFWTVVLEKTLESPLDFEEIQPGHPKGNSERWWSWSSNTLATWCEELIHWKRPWCWERLKAGGEGEHGGWDRWMASPMWWTRVWASSGNWWWTGKPGVLQSMESQRVGHNWATQLNWTCKVFQVFCWSLFFFGLSSLEIMVCIRVIFVVVWSPSHVWLFWDPHGM